MQKGLEEARGRLEGGQKEAARLGPKEIYGNKKTRKETREKQEKKRKNKNKRKKIIIREKTKNREKTKTGGKREKQK